MPPKIKIKPKVGVNKQMKAAATRAGFKSVAEYRKSQESPSIFSTGEGGGRSDKTIAESLGITISELNKRREANLQESLTKEAKKKNISVDEVKELRKKRKGKRVKKSKKRQYKINKEKLDKLTKSGVSSSIGKKLLDRGFAQLSKEEQKKIKDEATLQKKEFRQQPTIVPLDKPGLVPAGLQQTSEKKIEMVKKRPSGAEASQTVSSVRSDVPERSRHQIRLENLAMKRAAKQFRNKTRRAEVKLLKLIKNKQNVTSNKKKLKTIQNNLKKADENVASALKNQKPLTKKNFSGLNVILDEIIEAPVRESISITGRSHVDPLSKKVHKTQQTAKKVANEIVESLIKKGVPRTVAFKVANNQRLTAAEKKQVKRAGIRLITGKPGSARAETRLKKQNKREQELRKTIKEPIPEKWADLKGLESILGPVGKVPRGIGKVGQGRGKLFPGNLTSEQVQELIRGKALTKAEINEVEGMLKDPVSGLSETRKKGGMVLRRGTGKALRGFGKAKYSNKLY